MGRKDSSDGLTREYCQAEKILLMGRKDSSDRLTRDCAAFCGTPAPGGFLKSPAPVTGMEILPPERKKSAENRAKKLTFCSGVLYLITGSPPAGGISAIEKRSMCMKKKVIKIKGRATVSVKTDEDD